MKRTLRCGLLLLFATALLVTLNAQTQSDIGLLGKWTLNIAKSQYQNEPVPMEATLVVSAATLSHFKWRLSIAFAKRGKSVWYEYGYDGAIDGKPYDYQGAPAGTKLSYAENKGSLEATETSLKDITQHETITVSSDGNTMTAQCTASSPRFTSSWTEVWERVPDKKRK